MTESSIQKIYTEAAGVVIGDELNKWDERGKGYFGEYLVFREILGNLSGTAKVLMNLEIPSYNSNTTEIDLLLLHESGIYAFEMKYYKGIIYGKIDDEYWTQYFKTQKNSVFKSPVKQNDYHISNLKSLFPGKDIYSCICFPNDDVQLKIKGERDFLYVTDFDGLKEYLRRISSAEKVYSNEEIEDMFEKLIPYSKLQEFKPEEAPDFNIKSFVAESNDFVKSKIEEGRKAKKQAIILGLVIAIASVALNFIICNLNIRRIQEQSDKLVHAANENAAEAREELSRFKKNFEKVDTQAQAEFFNIASLCDFSFDLRKSTSYNDSSELIVWLNPNSDAINKTNSFLSIKDSNVIVHAKDGKCYEFVLNDNPINEDIVFATELTVYLTGITVDEIDYVKINRLTVRTIGDKLVYDKEFEYEVYSTE